MENAVTNLCCKFSLETYAHTFRAIGTYKVVICEIIPRSLMYNISDDLTMQKDISKIALDL